MALTAPEYLLPSEIHSLFDSTDKVAGVVSREWERYTPSIFNANTGVIGKNPKFLIANCWAFFQNSTSRR